jgi:AcrR family transcriptional regulator
MADTRPQQPTRRQRAREEARTRILAASAECIVRDGLAKVRMAGIAKAANVSAGLLHYHFDTKEKLFAELLAYSHGVSSALNEQAMETAGSSPAQRLMSFLDRCLPSDDRLAHEWLLWQELALLCIRQPDLAKVGAEVYEDLYSTVSRIIAEGAETGDFEPAVDARVVAETAVALCDGLGGRVLANDPHMDLRGARTALATTVGVLVGHHGPLPEPVNALADAAT